MRVLPLLLAACLSAVEPWADVEERLRRLGLDEGVYGIRGDIAELRQQQVPADDPRWRVLASRAVAEELSDLVQRLRQSKKPKKGATADDLPALRQRLIERLGANAAGLAPDDPALLDRAERWALARTRLAWIRADAIADALAAIAATWPEQRARIAPLVARMPEIARRIAAAQERIDAGDAAALAEVDALVAFQQEALLPIPLLDGRLLAVKGNPATRVPQWQVYGSSADPCGHGADNELVLLPAARPDAPLATLYRPDGRQAVGQIDLHWDADRILFTRKGQLCSLPLTGGEPQVLMPSLPEGMTSFQGCWLPDGGLLFCSLAGAKAVPCANGGSTQSIFRLLPDGTTVRRITFDQDHAWQPVVLPDGRVLYTRWDYTDAHHYYARLLMAMNPDGAQQMAIYGSNAYYPNGKYGARSIPGQPSRLVFVETGHVEPIGAKAGNLWIVDLDRGHAGTAGLVQRLGARGRPLRETTDFLPIRDYSAPRFQHPWPLGDAQDPRGAGTWFLAAGRLSALAPWGLYLIDTFDNIVPVREEPGWDLTEPVLVRPRPRPPVLPDTTDPTKTTATVTVADVYEGEGLRGVPRGTVRRLRVYAYHFAYENLAGHDRIGIHSGWEPRRILGTVPVNEDGSASFVAPANTPLALQPLDADGAAVQVMRSWYTPMPGERVGCVGCHESRSHAPVARTTIAQQRPPTPIEPWFGPPRPYSFAREVQPVLDRHCAACHDGRDAVDLRPAEAGNRVAIDLVHEFAPLPFPPAYRILQRFVRRYGVESDYILRNPGEWHASTSPLIQMLRRGHHGVQLDREAWERLYCWIDLNAPAYGTWTEIAAAFDEKPQKREELARHIASRAATDRHFGAQPWDPESYPDAPPAAIPLPRPTPPAPARATVPGWPAPVATQPAGRIAEAGGLGLDLMSIPAGSFVMGDASLGDPESAVRIERPFRMSRTEVTNALYARFDPAHASGWLDNLGKNNNRRGKAPLDLPEQPVVRVSHAEATAFCAWMSQQTRQRVRLPSEAEWEWACRAGAATPLHLGGLDADYGPWENLADRSLIGWWFPAKAVTSTVGPMQQPAMPIAVDPAHNDGQTVPQGTGLLKPNAFGLCDMQGNVQEWTTGSDGGAVARGGSWADRPREARASIRRPYASWQRVWNVGFRVVVED